jgi:hypothetical protein
MEWPSPPGHGIGRGLRLGRQELPKPLNRRPSDYGRPLKWAEVLRPDGIQSHSPRGHDDRVHRAGADVARRQRQKAHLMRRRPSARSSSINPSKRCAVYTRVSTDHGLEQDFNSLDAQREASEAYIRSQAHEGWILARGRYDDGGYSGASLDRPALKALLQSRPADPVRWPTSPN